MRAPSSFHSTAAGPVLARARVDVRRGRGQHRRDRAPDLEPERGQRLLAVASAAAATAPRSPRSISARRTAATAPRPPWPPRRPRPRPARPAAGRRGSAPAGRPARTRSRARAERVSTSRRARLRAGPAQPASASNAASTSATDSDGVAAGGGSSFSDAQPTPEHALARRPREVAGARRALLDRQRAQRRGQPRDLVLAPGQGADVLGGGGELGEQHAGHSIGSPRCPRSTAAPCWSPAPRPASAARPRSCWPSSARTCSPACARRRGARAGITPVELDITNPAHVAALRAHELDALVNNAGIATTGPLEFLPLDELRRQLEVNVIAQLAVTQACLPALAAPRGGSSTCPRSPVASRCRSTGRTRRPSSPSRRSATRCGASARTLR